MNKMGIILSIQRFSLRHKPEIKATFFTNRSHCIKRGKVCPVKTLECVGNQLSVSVAAKELKKDILFYENSRESASISDGNL